MEVGLQADPEGVEVQFDGHVATLLFWNGENNHMSLSLLAKIADALEALDGVDACRCIIVRSKGRVFCAGAELGPNAFDIEGETKDGSTGNPFYDEAVRLFATRKPIIASIQGAAVGAGLGLALVADFRICSPAARFSGNFVAIGIHAGFGISALLPRIVGRQNAALMLLTGRRVKPDAALQMGLIDVLAEADGLDAAAAQLAGEIAVNAPLAVEETRQSLRGELADIVRAQMRLEFAKQRKLAATHDYQEGLKAVRERRAGAFTRK